MKKTVIDGQQFSGERALYKVSDLEINNSIFADGESPLKHSSNIDFENSVFKWKYPLWHSSNISIKDGAIFDGGRAGIWYTDNIKVNDTLIEAPKEFRRCTNVSLENVTFTNAQETFWNCNSVELKNVQATGEYFAMNSNDLKIDGLTLSGNYPFDGCKNVEVRNSKLLSKDSFWNCENVTVYDSYICGEYLAWNSKNVTFVNCIIESEQGLCYIQNLKLVNCRLLNTNLAFEYSTVEADITANNLTIKNPAGGKIKVNQLDELIMDETKINPEKTLIDCPKIAKKTFEVTDPVII